MNLWPLGAVFPVCPHEHHEKKANRHRGVGMKQMEEKQRPKIENDHGILVWFQLFKTHSSWVWKTHEFSCNKISFVLRPS